MPVLVARGSLRQVGEIGPVIIHIFEIVLHPHGKIRGDAAQILLVPQQKTPLAVFDRRIRSAAVVARIQISDLHVADAFGKGTAHTGAVHVQRRKSSRPSPLPARTLPIPEIPVCGYLVGVKVSVDAQSKLVVVERVVRNYGGHHSILPRLPPQARIVVRIPRSVDKSIRIKLRSIHNI